jgi:Helix-turn-helix domain
MARLLTSEQAAEVLDMTIRNVHRLCRANVLVASFPEGKGLNSPRFFKEADVMAYLEIRDKKLDISSLATIARQAYVTSRAVERNLERVMYYLGLDQPVLSYKRQDVMRLYIQVEDALDFTQRDVKPEKVMEWARIFYAIGEEYLWLIEELLEDPEPWSKLLALASKLYDAAPRERFKEDPTLTSVYGYLNAGRRNLRNVAYFYIRNNHGFQAARKAFPATTGDRDDRIIGLCFPDQTHE